MNLFAEFEGHLRAAVSALASEGVFLAAPDPGGVTMEPTDDARHGDMTTSAAMILHKLAGMKPRDLADRMAGKLRNMPGIQGVDVAGPGFINLTIAPKLRTRMLASVLELGPDFGRSTVGGCAKARVVFASVSAASRPPDYGRPAIVAEALARLLNFAGYEVCLCDRTRPTPNEAVREEPGLALKIDVLGADEEAYFRDMRAAMPTDRTGLQQVMRCQSVRLLYDGKPIEMFQPSGDIVPFADLVEEVGSDAVRFTMLMRRADTPLDFDLAKAVEDANTNPVFLVQYAHARCIWIFAMARRSFRDLTELGFSASASLDDLDDEGELLILRRLAQYPYVVEQAARTREPHRIAFYLCELAWELQTQYNRGNELPYLRFIRDDNRLLTGARLALVRGIETVLKSGLSLLGVSTPDEMR